MTSAQEFMEGVEEWESNHAALVGRRNVPVEVPPSGVYWPGVVKAQITPASDGFRWLLVSGDGRFQLAQSPVVFPSESECERHLRGFSPHIQLG